MIVLQDTILKQVHRDIRITNKSTAWPQAGVAQPRAARFAQGVAKRYGGRRQTRPFLPLIFSQPQPTVFSRTLAPALHLRLALHVLHNRQQAAEPASAKAARSENGSAAPMHAPLRHQPQIMPVPFTARIPLLRHEQVRLEKVNLQRIYEREAVINRERLTVRLTSRSQRMEMTPSRSRNTAVSPAASPISSIVPHRQPTPTIPVLPPAPRTLRKSAPAGREGGWTADGGAEKRPFAPPTPQRQEHPAITTTPPIDINQLTTRVVQTIDQRIIAQRERMGRI